MYLVTALGVTAVVTWLMWTDWLVNSGVTADIPVVPAVIEEPVQQVRAGWGDADAHVVLWLLAAVAVAVAFRRRRDRQIALAVLAVWTVVVELLQPVFTELRALQLVDAVAGVVGVGLVAAADLLLACRTSP
jgi:hypothetical protein